jgi:hypothetical protein
MSLRISKESEYSEKGLSYIKLIIFNLIFSCCFAQLFAKKGGSLIPENLEKNKQKTLWKL